MTDCIFCSIASGQIPAEKIYEDDFCVAFLDINPVRPGHTLVIPREHFAALVEVPDNLLSRLYISVKKLLPAVKSGMAADFVVVNVVGTDVPHFHIHLIPRNHGDGLPAWPTGKYAGTEATDAAAKIKKELKL